MKLLDKNTRKIFHKIHKDQIFSKVGFKKIKNLLTCENLRLPKNYFKNKICGDFGCGSTGAGAFNLLELGAKYIYLMDLHSHIKKPINKNLKKHRGKYKIDIGSVEKTPYKKNFFDFILCQGVIHCVDNDKKALKQIYRNLKKGGKFHMMVMGEGGLVTRFLMEIMRPEFENNTNIRRFLQNIMTGKVKNYERYLFKNYDGKSKKIIKSLKKYIDLDFLLTIQDRLLSPKYKTYNEKKLKNILKKIGFKKIYRIKKEVKFNNLRRLLAPFYYDYDHEISRALYGEGIISLVMTK